MADSVQSVLDAQVPALRDLLTKGIFTSDEIRSIVSRRRRSEYLLRRKMARKADFLRYVEDETKLERLRSLRNRALKARIEEEESRKGGGSAGGGVRSGKSTSSLGDHSIVQNVHFVFVRALMKFRDDVTLHLAHAEFARRAGSVRRLGRIYAEALQVHPRNVDLWIEAASFEFFGLSRDTVDESDGYGARRDRNVGGSVRSARVMLQRGLRVNPTSSDLWLQTFTLEMHYVQKLRGRREVLKLGYKKKKGEEKEEEEDPDEARDYDDDIRGGGISSVMAMVVYRNAVKAVPDDVRFRLGFAEACDGFPDTGDIEDVIMDGIREDLGDEVSARVALAEYEGGKGRGAAAAEAAVRELDDAIESVPTTEMVLAAVRYARGGLDRLAAAAADDGVDDDVDDEEEEEEEVDPNAIAVDVAAACKCYVDFLRRAFHRAPAFPRDGASPSSYDVDLILERCDFLLGTDDAAGAERVLREAATSGSGTTNARIWLKWSDVAGRARARGTGRTTTAVVETRPEDVLRRAMRIIPIHDGGHLRAGARLLRLLLLRTDAKGVELEARDLMQRLLLLSKSGTDGISSVIPDGFDSPVDVPALCASYLRRSVLSGRGGGGLDSARDAYGLVLYGSGYARSCDGMTGGDVRTMTEFFEACLCLETSALALAKAEDNGTSEGGGGSSKVGTTALVDDNRRRLSKLYDSVIGFFRDGGDVTSSNQFKMRKSMDRLLRQ